MIRIEDIEEIPRLLWNETSSKEFSHVPYESRRGLLDLSTPVKLISGDDTPLLVAGLFRRSFFAVPYLWVLLTEDFKTASPAVLRALVRAVGTLAPQAETLVEIGNARAERLAKLFAFEPTAGTALIGDLEYRLYRRG
jgi:hypothetical protein